MGAQISNGSIDLLLKNLDFLLKSLHCLLRDLDFLLRKILIFYRIILIFYRRIASFNVTQVGGQILIGSIEVIHIIHNWRDSATENQDFSLEKSWFLWTAGMRQRLPRAFLHKKWRFFNKKWRFFNRKWRFFGWKMMQNDETWSFLGWKMMIFVTGAPKRRRLSGHWIHRADDKSDLPPCPTHANPGKY